MKQGTVDKLESIAKLEDSDVNIRSKQTTHLTGTGEKDTREAILHRWLMQRKVR